MAIHLQKEERLPVHLSELKVCIGWDPNPADDDPPFDLDLSALMLDKNQKIPNEGYFVFYNRLSSQDNSIIHSGDDRTGEMSDGGDDETVSINLARLDPQIREIIFAVTIYQYEHRDDQHFGQVSNSYIRMLDLNTGEEKLRYSLREEYPGESALEYGALVNNHGVWQFEARGIARNGGLRGMLEKYSDLEITAQRSS